MLFDGSLSRCCKWRTLGEEEGQEVVTSEVAPRL